MMLVEKKPIGLLISVSFKPLKIFGLSCKKSLWRHLLVIKSGSQELAPNLPFGLGKVIATWNNCLSDCVLLSRSPFVFQ
jgi:hypothetical protein